jgi:hypothetical protein
MSAETHAYYAGRSEAHRGGKIRCDLTNKNLAESFWRGVRHVNSEETLSNDDEWD